MASPEDASAESTSATSAADPLLAALETAYARGDYATVARDIAALPGPAAARFRGVVSVDPAAVYVACACLVLFGVLVYRYAFP